VAVIASKAAWLIAIWITAPQRDDIGGRRFLAGQIGRPSTRYGSATLDKAGTLVCGHHGARRVRQYRLAHLKLNGVIGAPASQR
jgi:hypothetical protein